MQFKLSHSLAMISLLCVSVVCSASTNDGGEYYNQHTGFYLGGNAGIALNYDTYPSDYARAVRYADDSGTSDFQGLGLGATLGYMIKPWVGIEVNFTGIPDPLNLSTQLGQYYSPTKYNYTAYWYGAAARFKLLAGKKLDLFLKSGVGVNYLGTEITSQSYPKQSYSESKVGGIFGGGVGYNFSKNSELTFGLDAIVSPQIYYLQNLNDPDLRNSYNGTSFWGNFCVTYLYYFN